MITCQRCSTDNLDGSQYCDECGALLSVVAPSVAAHLSSAIPPHAPVASPVGAPPAFGELPSSDADVRHVTNDRQQVSATDGDVSVETDPSQHDSAEPSSLAPTAALQMPASAVVPESALYDAGTPEQLSPEITFVAPVRKVSAPAAEQNSAANSFGYQSAEPDGAGDYAERAESNETYKPEQAVSPIAHSHKAVYESMNQDYDAAEQSAPADAPQNAFPPENGGSSRSTSDVSEIGGRMIDEHAPAGKYALKDEPQTSVSGATSGQFASGAYNGGSSADAKHSGVSSSSFAPPIPPAAAPSSPQQMPPASSATIANFSRTALLGGANHFGANSKSGNQVHAKLVIQRGRATGKEFSLSEDVTQIGRWDADGGIFPDVDLDADDVEAKVSRRHARIMRRGEQYFVEDLGSTNGTFVNRGRRLLPGDLQPLRDGDEVIVGKTFLKFIVLR